MKWLNLYAASQVAKLLLDEYKKSKGFPKSLVIIGIILLGVVFIVYLFIKVIVVALKLTVFNHG